MISSEDLADMEPKILRAIPGLDLVFIAPQWLVCHKELSGNCRVRMLHDLLSVEPAPQST
ncbi:hypothetical protein N9R27_03135 [Flavobacteriaceae bacterium]|nr:hypothetical protein [Flavobacteriaceae bacterium]